MLLAESTFAILQLELALSIFLHVSVSKTLLVMMEMDALSTLVIW
jgi:hypothetical protein